MIAYLDTSAAFKLLIDEPESQDLASTLDGFADSDALVSSMLLFTEVHCAAQRRGCWDAEAANEVLDAVDLIDLTRGDLSRAGTSGWGLRSADSLHLATALRIEADTFVAYDHELCTAATTVGLSILRPGVSS